MFQQWKKIVCRPLKILDFLITALTVGMTVFLICYWDYIPEQVPKHYNGAGVIDAYTDAGIFIPLIIFMYFFLAFHNITKLLPMFDLRENLFGRDNINAVAEEMLHRAYNLLFAMLWCCDLLLQLMFSYIILCGIFLRNLGIWFLPLCGLLFAADFIWFFVELYRLQKKLPKKG